MKRSLFMVIALIASISLTGWAQQQNYWILDMAGNTHTGENMTADRDGNLMLMLDATGQKTQTFKRGSYRTAGSPKTREIQALEQAVTQKNLALITKEAPALFVKYQYIGWGGHIAYLEGMANIDKGDFAMALQVFDRGLSLGDVNQIELLKGKVLALNGLKRNKEAYDVLDKLILAADARTAVFAFNARGRLLASEGGTKKKDAVLEYMKTLLLFKPDQAPQERDEARKAAVALLREMGDPRAGDIEKLP